MNKLFLTAVLFLVLSITAIGQENSGIAVSKGTVELAKSKTSGVYHFTLPKGTTSASVEEKAKYYLLYFKVTFVEATSEATITMVTNDEKSRHVICRFLTSSNANHVTVDGKEITLDELYTTYLK